MTSHRRYLPLYLTTLLVGPSLLAARAASETAGRLPIIGPAPAFTLDSSRGPRVALANLRGKVLAVTFIFTTAGREVERIHGSDASSARRYRAFPSGCAPARQARWSQMHQQ